MSQEVKKGPLAALTFESSKNFILTYFQKLMWFHLLATKDSLLAKFEGKLFSDAKYLGPLLQRSPLNRWLFLETRAWAACGLIYFMQAFERLKIDYLLYLTHYVIVLKYSLLSLLLLLLLLLFY